MFAVRKLGVKWTHLAPIRSCFLRRTPRLLSSQTASRTEETEDLALYVPDEPSKRTGKARHRNAKSLVRLSRDEQQGIAELRRRDAKLQTERAHQLSPSQQREFGFALRSTNSIAEILQMYHSSRTKLSAQNVVNCVVAVAKQLTEGEAKTSLGQFLNDESYRRLIVHVDRVIDDNVKMDPSKVPKFEQDDILQASKASSLLRSLVMLGEARLSRIEKCIIIFRNRFMKSDEKASLNGNSASSLAELMWTLSRLTKANRIESIDTKKAAEVLDKCLAKATKNRLLTPSHSTSILLHCCRLAEVLDINADHVTKLVRLVVSGVKKLEPTDVAMFLRSLSQYSTALNEALSGSEETILKELRPFQNDSHETSSETQSPKVQENFSRTIALEIQRQLAEKIKVVSVDQVNSIFVSLSTIYGNMPTDTVLDEEAQEAVYKILDTGSQKLLASVESLSDSALTQSCYAIAVLMEALTEQKSQLNDISSRASSLSDHLLRRCSGNSPVLQIPNALSILSYFGKDTRALAESVNNPTDEWLRAALENDQDSELQQKSNDILEQYMAAIPSYSNGQLREGILSLSISPITSIDNNRNELEGDKQNTMHSLVWTLVEELFQRVGRNNESEEDLRLKADLDLCALASWLTAVYGPTHTNLAEWTTGFWKKVLLWRNEVSVPQDASLEHQNQVCADLVSKSRDNLPAILLQLYQAQLNSLVENETGNIYLDSQLANSAKSLLIRSEKRRLRPEVARARGSLSLIHREMELASRLTAPEYKEQLFSTRAISGYITDCGYVLPLAFPELRIAIDLVDTSQGRSGVWTKKYAAQRLRRKLIQTPTISPESFDQMKYDPVFTTWDVVKLEENLQETSSQHLAAVIVDQLLVTLKQRGDPLRSPSS